MKRFLIHVSTNWCGMDDTIAIEGTFSSEFLEEFAGSFALENLERYDYERLIAENLDLDFEDMTDENWEYLGNVISDYYSYIVEEFKGTDDEWEQYDREHVDE